MELFNRPANQKMIFSTSFTVLAAGALGFVLLLIDSATRISNAVAATTVRGPWGLFELQKTPAAGGGYEASIVMLSNAKIYLGVVLVVTVVAVLVRLRLSHNIQAK